MEDKELQELFAAKRTAEANRRRQEELAAMIDRKTAKKRPLWPVWAGAAAAGIALLLFSLPSLFRTETTAPVKVAQVVVPITIDEPSQQITTTPRSTYRHKTAPAAHASTIISDIPVIESVTPTPTVDSTPAIEKSATEEEPALPVRRVMRRTSNMLACTDGCKAPEGLQEKITTTIQIDFFATQEYADATIITFGNNK